MGIASFGMADCQSGAFEQMLWTDEQIELLKTMWGQGKPQAWAEGQERPADRQRRRRCGEGDVHAQCQVT